jgi:hypothetical protein
VGGIDGSSVLALADIMRKNRSNQIIFDVIENNELNNFWSHPPVGIQGGKKDKELILNC